jgi:2'-5' RNA ligase
MAKERLKSPRARLFVALDLPDHVREGLVAWQRGFGDRALRPVRSESLHMTLVFLGYHPERDIERIAERALDVGRIEAPPVELAPEPLPIPRNRPRLFALDARADQVVAIQQGVSDRLEEAGFYEPEKRPFWPHLTVFRVRPERRGGKKPALVEIPPGPLPEELLRPFQAVRLRLYRSHLQKGGAEYVPQAEIPLMAANSAKTR